MFGNFTYNWDHIEYIEKEEDFDKISSNTSYCISNNITITKKHNIKNVHNIHIYGSLIVDILLKENTTLKFIDCFNIKIDHIRFTGPKTPDKYGGISLQLSHCNHCVIYNCVFIDGEDEQLSIKDGSDMIDLEYCRFIHSNSQRHSYSILIGKNRNDIPESGKYHIYVNRCLFKGGSGRNPRCRHSIVYLKNCVWKGIKDYIIGPENSEVYIDGGRIENCMCPILSPYGEYKSIVIKRPVLPKFLPSRFSRRL